MLKKVRLTITALFWSTVIFAQSGAIKVTMFNKVTKEPIPFANVVVELKGTQVIGGQTDLSGECILKPLDPAEYTVKAVYEGFDDYIKTGILVSPDQIAYVKLDMSPTQTQLKEVHVEAQRVDLVSPQTIVGQTIDQQTYQNLAVKDINSVAALSGGTYTPDVGGAISIRGARTDATQYVVDGVIVTADQLVGMIPQSLVDQETTVIGGIPAKYGDATGGIIEINTLPPSPKFFGSVEGITSEFLDPYGFNQVDFSLGGPLITKKDTANKSKKILVDFILGGEFQYKLDQTPNYIGGYTVNSTTLDNLQQNPFVLSPTAGFLRASEFVTANDINQSPVLPNNSGYTIGLNGKIGIHFNDNISLTLGGNFTYNPGYGFVPQFEMFDPQNNPLQIQTNYRAYATFKQSFKSDKNSIIQNAYYTLEAEYGNTNQVIENATYKDSVWKYGFVGYYNQDYGKTYQLENGRHGLAYYQTGLSDSLYTFNSKGSDNPILANYTSQLYNLLGQNNINSYVPILQDGGILNGYNPANVYSLYYNAGTPYGSYTKQNSSQFLFLANFSCDIKDHNIQLGFEYEQNTTSFYSLSAQSLYYLANQSVNNQIAQLDTTGANAAILARAGQYNYYNYNWAYNPAIQTQFDASMRNKLGLSANSQVYLQPNNYSPGFFNTNWFSASQLLNGGGEAQLVNYYGYYYLGNKLNSSTSLNDFFNQRDANGNLYYPIAPYNPIYIAGYIQDHFDYKSMKFDVGVRVDDFDANQPVLKDPYLLFPAKTVSEVQANPIPGSQIPSNMGSNYVVYVNNADNPTSIVGYRNGHNWYDANGNPITDPTVLAAATQTGTIQPYLENPSQTTLSSNAFTQFTPQINVMPRIAFSFPISDVAGFFAHYDILTQRPPGIGYNIFLPTQYLYMAATTGGQQTLQNPNLYPQQTTEYELGFDQILNEAKSSVLKISAFYRDNRSNVDVYDYLGAYPDTYQAFANIDFGTTKGLQIEYEMRRTNNIQMTFNYTLTYADGTGSGPTSGVNLAGSGQPNLEVPQPLNNDQRHTFNIDIDYHYGSGIGDNTYNGPVWTTKSGKNVNILANAGGNLSLSAGSGTPYTAQGNAAPDNEMGVVEHTQLIGSINGAYLPWQYRVDLRIDKAFPITINPSKGEDATHSFLKVYLAVTNLLNTENILNVYHFTNSPFTDGWLTSAQGQQVVAQSTNPQSYTDLYNIALKQPSYFAMPRQLNLGVEFDF